MRNSVGVTLIEMLIAMAIALVLMSVLFTLFVTSYQNYHLQNALLLNQNSALEIIHILKEDVERAGFIGCAKLTEAFPVQTYGEYSLSPISALTGNERELHVRHMELPTHVLLQSMQNDVVMEVNGKSGLNVGNIVVVSDCKRAEVFEVGHVYRYLDHQKIVATEALHNRFSQWAEVSRLVMNTYRIRDTGRKNSDGSRIMAMSVLDVHRHVTDLVDRVDQFQVVFGGVGARYSNVMVNFRVDTSPVIREWQFFAFSIE